MDTNYVVWRDTPEEFSETAISIKNGNFYWVDPTKSKYLTAKKEAEENEKNKGCCGKNKKKKDEKKPSIADSRTDVKKPKTKVGESTLTEPLLRETMLDSEDQPKKDEKTIQESKLSLDTPSDDATLTLDLNDDLLTAKLTDGSSVLADDGMPSMDLLGINMEIKRGSCVAIIGTVGSGKSSFLTSLFGEMYRQCDAMGTKDQLDSEKERLKADATIYPEVYIQGSVSYTGQQVWIRSVTLKENIIFNSPFDEQRYKDALHFSSLEKDLEQLELGDETILGEKGVNLSGGQKTRLSIARAIYQDSDIYLLDDPISALDVNVGSFIMDKCVSGYLKEKTRVICTHAIDFLPHFDYIYIFDKGRIIQQGNWDFIKDCPEFENLKSEKEQIIEKEKLVKEASKVSKFSEDHLDLVQKLTRQDSDNKANSPLRRELSIDSPTSPTNKILTLQRQMSLESPSILYDKFMHEKMFEGRQDKRLDNLKKMWSQVGAPSDAQNTLNHLEEKTDEEFLHQNSDAQEDASPTKESTATADKNAVDPEAALKNLSEDERQIVENFRVEDRAEGGITLKNLNSYIGYLGGVWVVIVMFAIV
jgi:ABC-type multidrug transport system ATPase subunit